MNSKDLAESSMEDIVNPQSPAKTMNFNNDQRKFPVIDLFKEKLSNVSKNSSDKIQPNKELSPVRI